MFNIGFGEILLIAVLALLVFGPDRLPDAARRAVQMMRQLREMAGEARKQVVDAAGFDDADTARVVKDLQDLHPRRMAASVLNPDTPSAKSSASSGERSMAIDPDLT